MADRFKTSPPLLDAFGRVHTYLRISVTDRCNLRCVYCMPEEGIQWTPKSRILRFEEIVRLTRLFARMGINKVRITGGEPLVRKNVERLIAEVATVPGINKVAMTTNGVLLAEKIDVLRAAGLTHLNISLDTLRQERFERIALRGGFEAVRAGIDAAIVRGFCPLKLNVVVMSGVNDDEVLDFVEFVQDRPINVRFIEFMPFRDNRWQQARMVSYRQMMRSIRQHYELIPLAVQDPSGVAKEFRIDSFMGTVGFITSMTDDFCSTCNRIRLTTEGAIKPCLHDDYEVSLRESLRSGASDAKLEQMIREAVMEKVEKHVPADELVQIENRAMIQIGG